MAQVAPGGTSVGGLYDPRFEHDACGVGLVADLFGRPTHALVRDALTLLEHLAHRGATGAEVATGDGAGILLQVPHRFYQDVASDGGFARPEAGSYAPGLMFLALDPDDASKARAQFEAIAREEGLVVLGW